MRPNLEYAAGRPQLEYAAAVPLGSRHLTRYVDEVRRRRPGITRTHGRAQRSAATHRRKQRAAYALDRASRKITRATAAVASVNVRMAMKRLQNAVDQMESPLTSDGRRWVGNAMLGRRG